MDSYESQQSPLIPGEKQPLSPAKKGILIAVVLIFCVATISLSAVKTAKPPQRGSVTRPKHDDQFASPLIKFKNPIVIMVSLGGFGFDYKSNPKFNFPNIVNLINGGTEADKGLVPVFPAQSVPNLYTIATGLYPENHGIVADAFPDPGNVGEDKDQWFRPWRNDASWWLGEPMWVTVTKRKLKAATFFWPGSEVKKDPWKCPIEDCRKFEETHRVSYSEMVLDVLRYFDSCNDVEGGDEYCRDDIPVLFNIYFDLIDRAGLQFGPNSDEVGRNITILDEAIGMLVDGLKIRGVFEEVNIILVSDHGMVSRNDENSTISLENIMQNTDIKQLPGEWVPMDTFIPLLAIQVSSWTNSEMVEEAVKVLNTALKKPEVINGDKLTVFSRDYLPERLHYSFGNASARIPAIVGLVANGYVMRVNPFRENVTRGGIGGYDNAYPTMRGVFIGHGPRFREGYKVPSFESVEIYNLVMEILGIEGVVNQGSKTLKNSVLLPLEPEMAPAPAPKPTPLPGA